MQPKVFDALQGIVALLEPLTYSERVAVIEAATALHVLIMSKKIRSQLRAKYEQPFTLTDAQAAEPDDE